MRKTLYLVVSIMLLIVVSFQHITAQEFRWPREKALEIAGGVSGNGYCLEGGYVRYFQPRKLKDQPFKKRFKSLTAQNKYVAFPCKRNPSYKIPPGVSAKVSGFFEVGSGKGIQYRIIGVNASFHYRLFSNKYLYASAMGGVSISNNRLLKSIRNEGARPDYYDRFKYGVFGGFEVERMIDRFQSKSIIVGWEEYYLVKGDSWGTDRWYAYIGLRFKV